MALTEVFTGANGTLGIATAGTDSEKAHFDAISGSYAGLENIGRVTGVDIRVQTDLEEFHEVGKRHAASLHPGNVHVSGRVGRAYVNGAMLYLLMGKSALATSTGADGHPLPQFVLVLNLNDPALPDNTLKVQVFGVRFENWALHVPEDDFVLEDLTFKAKSIAVTDTEAGSEIAVAFPA